ncbi:hypothetical protein SAMN05216257_101337 [Meinhardsimonia xiamenensis]|jgi:hypothetical protein|uniref:Uncharacterized protein n=1 Tax=Meinhardsimonia xiamenensis TaxID=990712 RepID=A0A1G8YKE3_9RHOB|nr:hypothetical protein [Meinhardsimonia xiamenensis]PRX37315.1 hypothetical protein LV81_01092 [Meinhardsimonia xiamenensis]SDK02550.1 hypothetical protein SAMN05216257_101337 [Meinhardsimonia xiamenensis]
MEMERASFRLPREMRAALERMAAEEDVSPGQILRRLIDREIARRARAKPPVRADERLLAPLRARLADDLAHAPGWRELQARLRAKGYELREAGGGLALHRWPEGDRLCKASELGFSYSALMRRLGAPFPGHAHRGLAARMLGQKPALSPSSAPGCPEARRSAPR